MLLFFRDKASVCGPGFPRTNSVDQGGLELWDLPTTYSDVSLMNFNFLVLLDYYASVFERENIKHCIKVE